VTTLSALRTLRETLVVLHDAMLDDLVPTGQVMYLVREALQAWWSMFGEHDVPAPGHEDVPPIRYGASGNALHNPTTTAADIAWKRRIPTTRQIRKQIVRQFRETFGEDVRPGSFFEVMAQAHAHRLVELWNMAESILAQQQLDISWSLS